MPLPLQPVRELADRRRLAHPVHADHEEDRRALAAREAQRRVRPLAAQDREQLPLDRDQEGLLRARLPLPGQIFDPVDQPHCHRHAEVARQQQLLQPLK